MKRSTLYRIYYEILIDFVEDLNKFGNLPCDEVDEDIITDYLKSINIGE